MYHCVKYFGSYSVFYSLPWHLAVALPISPSESQLTPASLQPAPRQIRPERHRYASLAVMPMSSNWFFSAMHSCASMVEVYCTLSEGEGLGFVVWAVFHCAVPVLQVPRRKHHVHCWELVLRNILLGQFSSFLSHGWKHKEDKVTFMARRLGRIGKWDAGHNLARLVADLHWTALWKWHSTTSWDALYEQP